MHEIGMFQELLDRAVERAREEGAERIDRLRVRIGSLSGVDAATITMAFAVLTRGTLAEGAALEIEPVMARFLCRSCGLTFVPESQYEVCPVCHGAPRVLEAGDSFDLALMELGVA